MLVGGQRDESHADLMGLKVLLLRLFTLNVRVEYLDFLDTSVLEGVLFQEVSISHFDR